MLSLPLPTGRRMWAQAFGPTDWAKPSSPSAYFNCEMDSGGFLVTCWLKLLFPLACRVRDPARGLSQDNYWETVSLQTAQSFPAVFQSLKHSCCDKFSNILLFYFGFTLSLWLLLFFLFCFLLILSPFYPSLPHLCQLIHFVVQKNVVFSSFYTAWTSCSCRAYSCHTIMKRGKGIKNKEETESWTSKQQQVV